MAKIPKGWLFDYRFTSRSRMLSYLETTTSEGLQNLGLCSTLRAFEQGGIFIVPYLLWHGASVFPVSPEGPPPFSCLLRHTRGCGGRILTRILKGPHSVAFYGTQGDTEDLFFPTGRYQWAISYETQVETTSQRYS
jgi:hypothetical protein